jgi:AraC-like DNA-binding protein
VPNLNFATIRLAHPLAFTGLLEQMGAPVDEYFRRQKLPALCDDPNAFVALNKAWQLFDDAAAREDQWFGWHVGQYVGDNKLNAGLLKQIETEPTLLMALKKLAQLVSSEASHLQLGCRQTKDRLRFFTHYPEMAEVPGYHVSQAYQLEVYIDLIRNFLGRDWQPMKMGIQGPQIPRSVRDRFPRSRLAVNQPIGYIDIPRSCLHRGVQRRHAKGSIESQLIYAHSLNSAQTLGLLLTPYLSEGYPTMQFAASLLDMSVRTLARRLGDCDTNYQAVLDETRFKKGSQLLNNTDAPIQDIAAATGWSSPANFSRMFSRMAGMSPSQYRKLQQYS